MGVAELCLIDDADGAGAPLVGRRVDDDVAVVVSVTPPGRRQRFGDTVRISSRDEVDGADGPEPGSVDRVTADAVLRRGGYDTWRLVAPHPGQRALVRLAAQLSERGATFRLYRRCDSMRIVDLWLVTPGTSPVELDAMLGAVTFDWVHPPAWPDLAVAAGGDRAGHQRRYAVYAELALGELTAAG